MSKRAVLLILLASASLAWGQTYKWRDASGRVEYSDTPPPPGARDVQQLRKPPGAPQASSSSTSPSAKSIAERDAEFRKRLENRQEAQTAQAKADEEQQARARNCEQAKARLAALDAGQRIARLNEQGERIMLDEPELAQARVEAQKAVETWCK